MVHQHEVVNDGDTFRIKLPNGRILDVNLYTSKDNEVRITTHGELVVVPQANNSVVIRLDAEKA